MMTSIISSILMTALRILFHQYLVSSSPTSHSPLNLLFDSRDISYGIFGITVIQSRCMITCRVEWTFDLKLACLDPMRNRRCRPNPQVCDSVVCCDMMASLYLSL